MFKKMSGMIAAVMVILVILQTAIVTVMADNNQSKNAIRSDFSDAVDLVNAMQIGWNLGNALDSINGSKGNSVKNTETCWGNPVTTKRMIEMVAKAGFKTVRVPVTYFGNSDWDANIDKEWLDRVEEVVNYVLDCDMYCIINVHHDTGIGAWITPDSDKYERSSYRMRHLWEQIAERFKNYDNRLIFEGMNEILNCNQQWTAASAENYQNVNKLNQIFVDTVRASGGNNSKRFLMVPLYAAIVSKENIDGFVLPKDTISKHLIISYHSYDTGEKKINEIFSLVKGAFLDKGVPAILGEFGMRNSTKEDNTQRRVEYVNRVVTGAKALGITCIWWDDGGYFASSDKVTNYCLLDRYSYRWFSSQVVNQLISASAPSNGKSSDTTSSNKTTTAASTKKTDASQSTTKKEAASTTSTKLTTTTASTTVSTTTSTTSTTKKATTKATTASNVTTNVAATTTKSLNITTRPATTTTRPIITPFAQASAVDDSHTDGMLFSNMTSGVKTDITLGVGCEYEFVCSLDNTSNYGNLMLSQDGKRIGYRVRQELSQIYTAYGYNNFKVSDIEPGHIYTISQKGDNTYVDGKLIMRNVTQNFNEGTLTIGDCRMTFYGMTIKQNGKVTHKLEPSKDNSNTTCILDKITGKQYYSESSVAYGSLLSTTTEKNVTTVAKEKHDSYPVKALSFPKICMGIETDIKLGVSSNYNISFSLDNTNNYGNLMLTHDGKRIGYRVRQEQSQVYTAYGYNNFKAIKIVAGKMYTVSQKGNETYVDGKLIMRNVTQNFNEGVLTIGDCRMDFYGMTVTEGSKITHKLVPYVDEVDQPCIFDEVTGKRYYSKYDISFIK